MIVALQGPESALWLIVMPILLWILYEIAIANHPPQRKGSDMGGTADINEMAAKHDPGPTDYERIKEELERLGAECKGDGVITLCDKEHQVECWALQGIGIVVIASLDGSGTVGLHQFMGKDGEPVEKDIERLRDLNERRLAAQHAEIEFGSPIKPSES